MATKYLKNNEGLVRAVTTDNLQLEKPLTNENYDVNVFNRNMDKVDAAIQEVKGKIDGLELVASNVKMADGTTVEDTVSVNKTSILNNTELVNQALNKANEAFQRGDNVKTQLVDKLISEGLNVSTNNTFEELISGIALGKKWASGETSSSTSIARFTAIDQVANDAYYFDITNLNFAPSVIVFMCSSANTGGYGTYINTKFGVSNWTNSVIFNITYGNSLVTQISSYTHLINDYINLDNGVIRVPLANGNNYKGKNYTWIAFE